MLKKENKYIYLLLAIPFFSYIFLLNAPGYFDDIALFQNNHWLLSGPKPSWFHVLFLDGQQSFAGYRPVLMQISQWNTQLLGANFFSWRLINLFVHISNGILLYYLICSFKVNRKHAFYMVLIFLLHPIQSIAVQFVWKRSTSFAVFFMFLGLCEYAYCRYHKYISALLQGTLFLLAFFCKEIAIIYPALLLSYALLNQKNLEKNITRQRVLFFLLFVCAAGLLWFRLDYIQGLLAPSLGKMTQNRVFNKDIYFLSSMRSVFHYVVWFFKPRPFLMNDPLPVTKLINGYTMFYITLILSSFLALLKKDVLPVAKFFIIGFWLSMLPHTSFYPMYNIEDQIRMYFAVASLAVLSLLTIDVALKKWKSKISIEYMLVPFIIVLIALTSLQNIKYYSPQIIWSDIVEEYDQSDFAHSELGDIYFNQKQYAQSIEHYQKSLLISTKPYYRVKIARSVWFKENNKQDVYEVLKPLDYKQLNIEEFSDFLTLFIMMEDYKRAQWLLGQVIHDFQNNERLVYAAGKLYYAQKDYQKADLFFKQVLKINPQNMFAQQYLQQIKSQQSSQ
ncbi:MAG TPA: tetratricopeptide repeat protein [Oligoflexia bacterium]|nr:tetratricopeptide repeat protein [Oligoflexia bacterium]HMR24734.1 tetratricopeptide repeat protein [Oligoflexia bacterium]